MVPVAARSVPRRESGTRRFVFLVRVRSAESVELRLLRSKLRVEILDCVVRHDDFFEKLPHLLLTRGQILWSSGESIRGELQVAHMGPDPRWCTAGHRFLPCQAQEDVQLGAGTRARSLGIQQAAALCLAQRGTHDLFAEREDRADVGNVEPQVVQKSHEVHAINGIDGGHDGTPGDCLRIAGQGMLARLVEIWKSMR